MNSLEFGFNSFWHILSLGPKPKQQKCLGWTIRNKDQNVWMSDMGKLFLFLPGIFWTVSTISFIYFTPPSTDCHLMIEVRIKTESILISKFSMPEVFVHSPHVCLLDNCTIKLFSVHAHILYYSSYQWNFLSSTLKPN